MNEGQFSGAARAFLSPSEGWKHYETFFIFISFQLTFGWMNHRHLFVCLEIESCKLFHKCRWGQSSRRCCDISNWDDSVQVSVQDVVCAPYLHFNVILQLSIQEVEGNRLLEFRILRKTWHLIHQYSTFTLLLMNWWYFHLKPAEWRNWNVTKSLMSIQVCCIRTITFFSSIPKEHQQTVVKMLQSDTIWHYFDIESATAQSDLIQSEAGPC